MPTYSTANEIPTMTSNNAPSGNVLVSSIQSASYSGYLAFDKSISSGWITNSSTSGYISYEFTNKVMIYKYSITSFNGISQAPKNWTFEGSNDGVNWTVLDTQANVAWASVGLKKEYMIVNPMDFKVYRLNITANNGGTTIAIGEIEMYRVTYSSKILLSSGGRHYSIIKNSGLYSANIIPTMSSNTSSVGTSSANLVSSATYDAWKAFDGIGSTYWYTNSGTGSGWLRFKFNESIKIEKYKIMCLGASNPSNNIKNWTFEGSDNGINWNIIDTRTNIADWITGTFKEFEITNDSTYIYYRLNITATNGTAPPAICELTMHTKTVADSTLINIGISDEITFLKYAVNWEDGFDLTKNISTNKHIGLDATVLGSGKTFEHTVDMSKRRVDKIKLG